MAEKILIEVEAEGVTIKELRQNVAALKKELAEVEVGSEDFAKASKELAAEQNRLNNALKLGKTSVDAADKSYVALTRNMAQLKEASMSLSC